MRKQSIRLIFAGLLACAVAVAPAMAQGNGKGKGKGHGKHGGDDAATQVSVQFGFGPHDREVITHYYAERGSGLPPGLAKRGGNLPPGLERQLERNGTLPPGLQKKLQPCPVELERQLPPLPADYRRAVIGAHIVILNRHTNVIVDILKDVVR